MKPPSVMLAGLLALGAGAPGLHAAEGGSVQKRDTTEFGVHDRPWANDLADASDEAAESEAAYSCAAGLEEAVRWVESAIGSIAVGRRTDASPPVVRDAYIEAVASLSIIAEERADLDRRRSALADREAVAAAAEKRVREEIAALRALKDEVGAMIDTLETREDENIARMTALYQGMQAKHAARLLAAGDRAAAIEILDRMQERDAAALIARMAPDDAEALMTIMTERARTTLDEDAPAADPL